MKPSKKNFNKQKNPLDIFTDNEIENMSKMFRYYTFIEMLDKMYKDTFKINNWYSCSFINNTSIPEGSEDKQSEINSLEAIQQTNEDIEEGNPPFDIINSKDKVTITIEMPDIKEEEIDIQVTKKSIEIFPNNPVGKYHKSFDLPYNVEPSTLTFTFRNGILDIIIKRSDRK